MADENAQVTEPAETDPIPVKGKSRTMLFVIIGIVVVAVIGAVAAYALGVFSKSIPDAGKDDAEQATPVKSAGPLVALKPFIVNLADEDDNRYLKVTVELEVKDASVEAACEERAAKIKDVMISLFSSKTFDQIRDIKGKIKLRQEITTRLDEILGTKAIRQVFFTEFIVQ